VSFSFSFSTVEQHAHAAGTWGGTEKPLEDWEKCININLMSLMRLTNLAVPHLEKKGTHRAHQLALLPLFSSSDTPLPRE
jgi:NAD(P)-dependent dehydrogenase (short-subunit alcohol dehydrogenase family)